MLEGGQNNTTYEVSESHLQQKKSKKWIVFVVIGIIIFSLIILFFVRQKKNNSSVAEEKQNNENLPVVIEEQIQQPEISEEVQKIVDSFADDKDRDGLSAEKEKELGTSDNEFDTDWDGLSDVAEIEKWKTDPTKADTDGDGYSDGYEINQGFNPKGPGKI